MQPEPMFQKALNVAIIALVLASPQIYAHALSSEMGGSDDDSLIQLFHLLEQYHIVVWDQINQFGQKIYADGFRLFIPGGPASETHTKMIYQTATSQPPVQDIPRFARNSPFKKKSEIPAAPVAKRIWAKTFLWEKAPDLVVEKWLTKEPVTQGKYLLIEFWATWCGPCRRAIPKLNAFHEKYKDELVVIGISDETEAAVRKLTDPQIKYFNAIDTQARTKKAIGVLGIPHVIIIEPSGYVVWEGFPELEGFELTETIVDKILAVGRKLAKQEEN